MVNRAACDGARGSMFKKKDSVALAPAHLVSGADRKKLGRRLETMPGMPEGVTAGEPALQGLP